MGVYTPDQALNAEKKGNDTNAVAIEIHEKAALTGDCGDEESAENVYNETTVPVIRERRQAKQKRRLWLQLILIIGMLVGLTLCVIGSVHLYRGMRSTTSYRGRCGVGVIDMSVMNFTAEESIATTNPWERDVVRCGLIEDVEIIGEIETLIVPKQNKSSPATFRHDFNLNKTAIKDDLLNLCFLVPFLPDFYSATVPSPAQFSFILNGRVTDADMPVVYELNEYFSVGEPVGDMLTEFGDALTELCAGATPYRMEPTPTPFPGDAYPAYEFWQDKLIETTPKPLPPTTVGSGYMVDVWYKMYPGGDALFNYHIRMEDDFLYNYDGGY